MGILMKRVSKIAQPAALAALLLSAATPASAQFAGTDEFQQMEQFAPVLEAMKRHMGKRRFGQLMQTVGPMMDQMMTNQGSTTGSYGAFGGGQGYGGAQGFDVGHMASMINPQTIAGLVQAFEPDERPRRTARKHVRRVRR
jgi:hypothetical protein